MSRTLSMNSGSFESLNVSVRCGWSANAFQIRATADWLSPSCFAKSRVLQCVASRGADSSVVTMARSICASVIFRGVPAGAHRASRRSAGGKASTPFADRLNGDRQDVSNGPVGLRARAPQHDPRPQREGLGCRGSTRILEFPRFSGQVAFGAEADANVQSNERRTSPIALRVHQGAPPRIQRLDDAPGYG